MDRLHKKKYQGQHAQQAIARFEAAFHGAQEYHDDLSCNDFVTMRSAPKNCLDSVDLLS